MAISSTYRNPGTGTKYFSFDLQRYGSQQPVEKLDTVTVTATASRLTSHATASTYWTDKTTAETICASGVILLVATGVYGILTTNSKEGDTASVAIAADRVLLPKESGASPGVGKLAYLNSTTGEITHSSSGTVLCGKFASASTFTNATDNILNQLPAGDWVLVNFDMR